MRGGRAGVVAAAVAAAAVGLLGGGLAAYVAPTTPTASGTAVPVPASPSYPSLPTQAPPTVLRDIAYPPLRTPISFQRFDIGNDNQTWSYVVPRGWRAFCVLDSGERPLSRAELPACDEVRFRPADEPASGGFSLRVKAIADHEKPSQELADRVAKIMAAPDIANARIIRQSSSAVYLDLLTGVGEAYLRRYNYFQWFAAPGSTTATLEMSVTGRAADQDGLSGLFDLFASQLRAVEAP